MSSESVIDERTRAMLVRLFPTFVSEEVTKQIRAQLSTLTGVTAAVDAYWAPIKTEQDRLTSNLQAAFKVHSDRVTSFNDAMLEQYQKRIEAENTTFQHGLEEAVATAMRSYLSQVHMTQEDQLKALRRTHLWGFLSGALTVAGIGGIVWYVHRQEPAWADRLHRLMITLYHQPATK